MTENTNKPKRDLNRVYDKLTRVIEANFSKPIALESVVRDVIPLSSTFIIETTGSDKTIKCICKTPIEEIQIGNQICLEGILSIDETGSVCIKVNHYYLIERQEAFMKQKVVYDKLQQQLTGQKLQDHFAKLNNQPIPRMVCNIGLIVLSNENNPSLQTFKNDFQSKCVGELFIYHLKENKIGADFKTACQYFKRYHQIDMICMIRDGMTMDHVLNLSTTDNIKYLARRKEFPYIVSIESESSMPTLISSCVNKVFSDSSKCIEFIVGIQTNFMKDINDSLLIGKTKLNNLIQKYSNQLFDCELLFSDMVNISQSLNPIEKLKSMLIKRLDHEKNVLFNVEVAMGKTIIHDAKIMQVIPRLIEGERKMIRDRQISQQKQEIKTTSITAQDEIIPDTNPQKIENKTSDKDSSDKLNINIKRADGEF
jgi:hypothetical protein